MQELARVLVAEEIGRLGQTLGGVIDELANPRLGAVVRLLQALGGAAQGVGQTAEAGNRLLALLGKRVGRLLLGLADELARLLLRFAGNLGRLRLDIALDLLGGLHRGVLGLLGGLLRRLLHVLNAVA